MFTILSLLSFQGFTLRPQMIEAYFCSNVSGVTVFVLHMILDFECRNVIVCFEYNELQYLLPTLIYHRGCVGVSEHGSLSSNHLIIESSHLTI